MATRYRTILPSFLMNRGSINIFLPINNTDRNSDETAIFNSEWFDAPVTVTRYVTTSSTGGDGTTNATSGANAAYTGLTSWLAAEKKDLVVLNQKHEVICNNGTETLSTSIDLKQFTTSLNNTLTVKSDYTRAPADPLRAVFGYNFYSSSGTVPACVSVPANTIIDNMYFRLANTSGSIVILGINGLARNVTIKNCIFSLEHATTTAWSAAISVAGANNCQVEINNCLIYCGVNSGVAGARYGLYQYYTTGNSVVLNNCTITGFNATTGAAVHTEGSTSATTLKNCVMFNNLIDHTTVVGGATNTFTTCYSDTTATGVSDFSPDAIEEISWNNNFVNYSRGDFRLRSDSVLVGAGTTIGTFTDDITGRSRSGSYDIGAYEYIAPTMRYVDVTRPSSGDGLSWATAYKSMYDCTQEVNTIDCIATKQDIQILCRGGADVRNTTQYMALGSSSMLPGYSMTWTTEQSERSALGTIDTSKYYISASGSTFNDSWACELRQYVTVDGIQFYIRRNTGVNSSRGALTTDAAGDYGLNIRNCIFDVGGTSMSTGAVLIEINTLDNSYPNFYIENNLCIFKDIPSGTSAVYRVYSTTLGASNRKIFLLNNTFINTTANNTSEAIRINITTTVELKNNIFQGFSSDFLIASGNISTSDYNLTSNSSLPAGSNNQVSKTLLFAGTGDYRLNALDDAAINTGVINYANRRDLEGNIQNALLSLGAYKYKGPWYVFIDSDENAGGTPTNVNKYTSTSTWPDKTKRWQGVSVVLANTILQSIADNAVIIKYRGTKIEDTAYTIPVTWKTANLTLQGDYSSAKGLPNRDNTKYRLTYSGSNENVLNIAYAGNLIISNSQITYLGNNSAPRAILTTANDTSITFQNCYIEVEGSGASTGYAIYNPATSNSVVTVVNSIVRQVGFPGGARIGIAGVSNSTNYLYVYNTLVEGFNNTGIERADIVKNCIVFNNADDFANCTTIENCASDDGDGTNSIRTTNISKEFVNYAAGDFNLKRNSLFIGKGQNLSSTFTTDMKGNTITRWDLGPVQWTNINQVTASLPLVASVGTKIKYGSYIATNTFTGPTLNDATGTLYVKFSISSVETESYNTIFSLTTDATFHRGISIDVNSVGKITARLYNGTSVPAISNVYIKPNVVYTAVVRMAAGPFIQLFVNNTTRMFSSNNAGNTTTLVRFLFGGVGGATPGEFSNCTIYDAAYWNSNLTTAVVRELLDRKIPPNRISVKPTYYWDGKKRLGNSEGLSIASYNSNTVVSTKNTINTYHSYENTATKKLIASRKYWLKKIQPKERVEIDWSNPITKGLIFASIPSARHPNGACNLVTKEVPEAVYDGTNQARQGNDRIGYFYGAVSGGDPYGISHRKILGNRALAGKLTMLSHCTPKANGEGYLLSKGVDVSNVEYTDYAIGRGSFSDQTYDWVFYTCKNGTVAKTIASTLPSITNGNSYVVGARVNADQVSLFANGKIDTTQTHLESIASIASGQSQTSQQISCPGRSRFLGVPEASFVGNTYLGAIWLRDLTNAELYSLMEDPYQIFKPINELREYVEVPAANIFQVISVDGDNTIYDTQVVNIVGTGFGTTQGLVYLDDVQQSINSWADTVINITVAKGALSLGTHTIKVYKPV